MGYQVYEDSKTGRWAGYGVPAECDRPDCATKIDRGLAYRCEDHGHWRPLLGVVHSGQTGIPIPKIEVEWVWVEEEGCGLFFCPTHLPNLALHYGILPKGESPEWLHYILTHESWAQWRKENPDKVKEYRYILSEEGQRRAIPATPTSYSNSQTKEHQIEGKTLVELVHHAGKRDRR